MNRHIDMLEAQKYNCRQKMHSNIATMPIFFTISHKYNLKQNDRFFTPRMQLLEEMADLHSLYVAQWAFLILGSETTAELV